MSEQNFGTYPKDLAGDVLHMEPDAPCMGPGSSSAEDTAGLPGFHRSSLLLSSIWF